MFTNDEWTTRIGDITYCTDVAVEGSPNVYVNDIPVHRLDDGTAGHQTWVPNASSSGSPNVFANGGS